MLFGYCDQIDKVPNNCLFSKLLTRTKDHQNKQNRFRRDSLPGRVFRFRRAREILQCKRRRTWSSPGPWTARWPAWWAATSPQAFLRRSPSSSERRRRLPACSWFRTAAEWTGSSAEAAWSDPFQRSQEKIGGGGCDLTKEVIEQKY